MKRIIRLGNLYNASQGFSFGRAAVYNIDGIAPTIVSMAGGGTNLI